MSRRMERRFKRLFGSNRCSLHKNKRIVEVTFNLGPCIQHLMSVEENTQTLHAIKTIDDPHWLPTLEEFGNMSAYFKLLQKLCEDSVHPTPQQISRLLRTRSVKMTRVLNTIYGNKVVDLLRRQEQ